MNSLVKSVKAKEQILLNNCHHLHGGLFRFFIRENVVLLRKKNSKRPQSIVFSNSA